MYYNKDRGYGRAQFDAIISNLPTGGRVFYVGGVTGTQANYNDNAALFTPDDLGNVRLFATITAAIAACTAGRGDIVVIDPTYTTAPTLANLIAAQTAGITMYVLTNESGKQCVEYSLGTKTLPASTTGHIFTVTGKIRLLEIAGEVTTAIQAQANATKLQAKPTVGSAVDLCATLDINGLAVGSVMNITGTLANAMVYNANGAQIGQVTPIIIPAGYIDVNCAATNTGAIKWTVLYVPLDPGAAVFGI